MPHFGGWVDVLVFGVLALAGYGIVAWLLERLRPTRNSPPDPAPPLPSSAEPKETLSTTLTVKPPDGTQSDTIVYCPNPECRQICPPKTRYCARCGCDVRSGK